MRKRLVIGLTGSFGSGKSTAAKLFKKLGACHIDCDEIVSEVYRPNNSVFKKIVQTVFASPKGAKQSRERRLLRRFAPRKDIKAKLAAIVFTNEKKRRELEALIHPYVFNRIKQIVNKCRSGVVLIDMPLLFEVGFNKKVDLSLVVSAGARTIEKRLVRKGFSKTQIKRRLKAQMPIREKIKRADLVIENSGTKKNLERQIKKIWRSFKNNP